MRRRFGIAIMLLGLVGALTACTPPQIGKLGIERNSDGTLTVHVRICVHSVDELRVRPINSFPNEQDGGSSNDRWESARVIEENLDPAVTGAASIPFPVDEGALEPDVLYEVSASGREGNASSGLFGASELAALQPGEVLADPTRYDDESEYVRMDGRGGVFVIVSREEFEQRADWYCR